MIVAPYTKLHPETAELLDIHAPDHLRWELDPADDTAYAELLRRLWRGCRGDLIIIEQDIGINHAVVPQLTRCTHPWCGFAYPVQGRPVFALGCVRFRAELLVQERDLMDEAAALDVDGFGVGHWRRLDVAVERTMRSRGYAPHLHYPDVSHFHEY